MDLLDEPLFNDESQDKERSEDEACVKKRIQELVESQQFCVLSTQAQSQPYASLVAYAVTPDLRHFFFTTAAATRKYRLLSECKQVALLIDSRCRHQEELTAVEALTVTGRAEEISDGPLFSKGRTMLKGRHPYLKHFVESDTTALFAVSSARFLHVTRFQEVSQWVP